MMLVMAGAIGVPPDGFTFRELYTMYMSRGRQEWDRTLAIVSMVYSVAPFDKEKVDFDECNPFRASRMAASLAGPSSTVFTAGIPPHKVASLRPKRASDVPP